MRSLWNTVRMFVGQLRAGLRRSRMFVSPYTLIAVLAVGVAIVSFHTWSMIRLSRQAVTEVESAAKEKMASIFAERLRVVGEKGTSAEIEHKLDELASLSPSVRLYIVDSRGIVRRSPSRYGRVILPFVDLKPLRQALVRHERTVAIFGDDPHNIRAHEPIAAAAVRLRGVVEYVYVVLAPHVLVADTDSFLGLRQGAISVMALVVGGVFACALILAGVYAYHNSVSSHIAAISHDLRSPLGVIQGYLETLVERGDRLSADEREHFVSVALRSTRSASDLVNDVHQLSKLEATDGDISREPVSAGDLMMDVVMALKPACDAKGVSLEVDVSPALPLCFGNVQLLERLARNVVENSLRYTPTKGSIKISITHTVGAVRVTVLDSGVGIPRSELDRVTEAFFRGKGSSLAVEGSGLGLSIANKIASLHGGELKIVSKESEGTAVIFTIPAYAQEARQTRSRLRKPFSSCL